VIESLTGEDRDLAGYVGAEVLDRLPARVRRFLARTSVLDRLSASLCDEVAGRPDGDGEAMLALVEQQGLFVRRAARGAGWFSYHPLFRDVLRSDLRRSEADAEHALLVRAAGWHLARDEPSRAADYLIEAGDEARLIDLIDRRGRTPAAVDARQHAAEVRLLVAQGDIGRARSVLDRAVEQCPPTSDLAAVAVQVAVARHDLEAAATRLGSWRPDAVEPRARLERELWAAIVAAESGDRRQARARVVPLIAEARDEGHVRLFLDAGGHAERLLRGLHPASPSPYLRRILECARSSREAATREAPAGLSDRELEVVRYLPTALSNAEIAAHLYVSVNTVKTHMRAISRKLGVTGRREAIERAEDLGVA
jgi:DNA-binding CsgD family transcriptional regulator